MRYLKKTFAFLLLFSALSLTYDASAQNREIGLKFTGLDNFNLVYKKKKEENKYLRYYFGFFNTNLQGTGGATNFSSSVGFSAGIEKRKQISNKLQFAHGFLPGIVLDGFFTANNISGNENYGLRVQPQLGYSLGVQYHFSEKFYLGLEAIPSISAAVNFGRNQSVDYSIQTSINMNTIGISAVYRFTKV